MTRMTLVLVQARTRTREQKRTLPARRPSTGWLLSFQTHRQDLRLRLRARMTRMTLVLVQASMLTQQQKSGRSTTTCTHTLPRNCLNWYLASSQWMERDGVSQVTAWEATAP